MEKVRKRVILRALESRNYRLFFAGQSISLIGTWLTRIATSWLVYRLTGSALLLGVVAFGAQIPVFILSPFAGVMVDRWNRHRVLVWTQFISMLQSFGLAALTFTRITVWEIVALNVIQGIVNALDTPARQSFLVEMVESREALPSAIALNSSMVNGTRLVGPSVAGILIALVGEGGCFLIDGISYLAVIGSLFAMQIAPRETAKVHGRVLQELKEGFDYVFRFPPIRTVLLLLAIVSLMGMPYTVLMPIIATQVFHGGPNTLGFLMAGVGLGALAGALCLAMRRSVVGLGKVIAASAGLFGTALIAFSASHWLPLSLFLVALAGFGMMVEMAASNTILQTIVEEKMRGRLMSFYTMAFLGTAPFGSLLAGAAAARIGATATIALGGAVCIAAAAVFANKLPELREMVRPIYVRLGIVPEIATAIQNAADLTEQE